MMQKFSPRHQRLNDDDSPNPIDEFTVRLVQNRSVINKYLNSYENSSTAGGKQQLSAESFGIVPELPEAIDSEKSQSCAAYERYRNPPRRPHNGVDEERRTGSSRCL